MTIQIIIGLIVGVFFGAVQILILNKVVKTLTSQNGGNNMFIILMIVQVFVFVALLVLIGLYSIISCLVAGVAMAITALIIWIKRYKD